MKTIKSITFSLVCIFALIGCTKTTDNGNMVVPTEEGTDLRDFAEILSLAVYNEPELREFLKKEALKEFDRDYDVFYPFVKNSIVCDGQTFRDLLLKYDDANHLPLIEEKEPLAKYSCSRLELGR